MKWQEEARALLQDLKAFRDLARRVSVTTTQDFTLAIDRADGPFVWDIEGKRYFEFSSAVGSANLGYRIPEIADAVREELLRTSNIPDQDWATGAATLLKKKLCEITPGSFPKKAFLCESGSTALEALIKITTDANPERKHFLCFDGAFHGRTNGPLSFHGSKPVHREGFPLAIPQDRVHRLIFPEKGFWNGDSVINLYRTINAAGISLDDINSIFLELVQGEGGINVASEEQLRALLDVLKSNGVKIIVDEVQTGFWRTGKLFASEHYGIEPDGIALAKSLGNGVYSGAVVIRAELDFKTCGRLSNTSGGMAADAASANTAIEIMESLDKEALQRRVETLGKFAPEGLGLMRRWRFANAEDRDRFVIEARRRGVLLLGSGKANVRFMPQINLEHDLLKEALEIISSIDIPHL